MSKKPLSLIANTVVMIRPLTFCSNPETISSNSFQKSSSDSPLVILKKAQDEFDLFQEKLKASGIEILSFEEKAGANTPDALFPNNWLAQMPDGKVYLFPMQAKNRQKEVRKDILKKIKATETIDLTPYIERNQFLEGTGSLVCDHRAKIAYACLSPRTSPDLLREFSEISGYRVVAFHSLDRGGKDIYHTNVMMAVGERNVVVNLSSIPESDRKIVTSSLQESGKNIVAITHDQMENLAGNMLFLQNKNGKKFWVCSTRAYDSLTKEQKEVLEREGTFIHSALTTIEDIGGGGARCLMAEIFHS